MTQPKRYKQITVMVNGDLSPSMFWLHFFFFLCFGPHTYIQISSSSIMQNWFTGGKEKKAFQIREKQVFIPQLLIFFNVCCSSMLYNPLILFRISPFFWIQTCVWWIQWLQEKYIWRSFFKDRIILTIKKVSTQKNERTWVMM